MKELFSTASVHPRDRFDYWHSIACATIVKHSSVPADRLSFQANIRIGSLAGIRLIDFNASPMSVAHEVRHIATTDPDDLFVCRQFAGRMALEQNTREVQLERGDITVIDPRLPYTGRFAASCRVLVLKVPRRLLEARISPMSGMIGRLIRPLEAEHRLTSAFLAMLTHHLDQLSPTSQDAVQNQVLDLLAVSLLSATGSEKSCLSSARALVSMRIRAAVEARLADPALDPASVACAAGVSTRYANAVLAEEGTSIARLIQERRLARCRAVFESQAHRKVSEVAYSWGFTDMTHFGRKFREVYGVLPTAYRKQAIAERRRQTAS